MWAHVHFGIFAIGHYLLIQNKTTRKKLRVMANSFDYIITLKKKSPKAVNLICLLLLLIAFVTFLYFYIGVSVDSYWKYIHLVVINVFIVIWTFVILFKKSDKNYYYRLAIFAASLGWLLQPIHMIWIGIAYIVIGFLEKQVKFPFEIGFSKNEVVINSFPKKAFAWSDIKNAIIKDSMLTLQFHSGKILQQEVSTEVDAFTAKEFNNFCLEQLAIK